MPELPEVYYQFLDSIFQKVNDRLPIPPVRAWKLPDGVRIHDVCLKDPCPKTKI